MTHVEKLFSKVDSFSKNFTFCRFCQIFGKHFFIVCHYFSKFEEIREKTLKFKEILFLQLRDSRFSLLTNSQLFKIKSKEFKKMCAQFKQRYLVY